MLAVLRYHSKTAAAVALGGVSGRLLATGGRHGGVAVWSVYGMLHRTQGGETGELLFAYILLPWRRLRFFTCGMCCVRYAFGQSCCLSRGCSF
jgi:hypothetical protein